MGQATPQGTPVTPGASAGDGLADQRQAVQAARDRLGRDLDRLITDTRAQMEATVEKVAWKLAAGGAGLGAALLVTKALTAGWRAVRKTEPPINPWSRHTSFVEALLWTAAIGAAAGIARTVAARGAAVSWEKATGKVPPGVDD